MARRKIKNKEQTFEVSQDELQGYYSRYLPHYGPGGPLPATNPWFKIANLGNKLSNFKNVSNKDIKAKDYMKFSLTNTAKAGDLSGDETEFLMNDDGTFQVDENNKKIPNPLYDTGNRYLSMDEKNNPVMLTYGQNRAKILNPLLGTDSERVKSGLFTERRINPVTGKIEYVNADGSTRTSGDVAEDHLRNYNAESLNFDENNNVVSWNTTKYNDYNEPTEIITNPYDVNNPYNIKNPYSKQSEINDDYIKKDIPVEVDVNENIHPKSQKQINEDYLKKINENIDETTKKYGGQLPKAQNSEEVVFENWSDQFEEADLQGALDAQAENYGIADAKDIDPTTGMPSMGSLSAYGEVWGTENYADGSWDDVEGVTPTTADFQVDDMAWHNDQLVPEAEGSAFVQDDYITGDGQGDLTLGKDKMNLAKKNLKVKNKADAKALKLANKEQRAKKRKMWGDTFGQQVNNFGNYALDKLGNSKAAALADITVDTASIFTDFKKAQNASIMAQKPIQGMNTIDNLIDPLEANAEGTRGNYDTLTGLLRIDDAVVSELARDGKELKKYQGQFSPSEVQQMQEYAKNNPQTIKPYVPSNYFPTISGNPNFLQSGDKGSLNPLSINWEGEWQDDLGMHNRQEYMIPGLNTKTGEWGETPYNTSFMQEWDRMGVEPTFTFTSAGGPGGGFRTYFPYSDPMGVGWEFDLDPTGPGTGILLNTGALRNWSNNLADRIGDNSVGNSFRDLNLPPGFLYAGVEVAGNVPAPFVGATVTLDDTENLEHWLQLPENEGKSNVARGFMHAMGPGLHAWNMPSKLSGQMTINNPFNVMGEPLWKSPDLFGGRKIHNPFSGTRTGLGGISGLKGGNVVPNLEIAGKQILSLEGGFAAIKEEVTELAEDLMKKNKNLSHSQAMKKAYSETAGSINTGKVFEKLKIPKVLDYAGELVYGAPGSGVTAPYQKSGNTLANYLKNSKFNYGKFINNPWFWKTIARGLMVPDIMNTVTGAMHQEGQPISDAWEGVFGEDPRNSTMEKYGSFPRMQRWWYEGIDPVLGAKWWKSEDEEHDDNMTTMNQLYEEAFMKKYNVTKDEINDKADELQIKNNWEYSHDPVLLKEAEKNAPAEVKKVEKIIKKQKAKEDKIKRARMHNDNPYLTPKWKMGGQPSFSFSEFQTGGEPESLTSLRRFTEGIPNEIGYNEEDILNQKLSLAEMKHGGSNVCPICGKLKSQCRCNYKMGGSVDIDEQLLQELIAAGADIEIL